MFQFAEPCLDRDIGLQGHQFPAHPDLIGLFEQSLTPFRLPDLGRPFKKRVEVAIFVDQLRGDHGTDSRCSGKIVDRIPCKRLDIDNLVGADAEFRENLFRPDPAIIHGIQHLDAIHRRRFA